MTASRETASDGVLKEQGSSRGHAVNHSALMGIMYGPYDYVHPDRRRADGVALDQLPRSIANQLLIERHALDTRINFALPDDPYLQRCVAHWSRLPRICFLMGVRRLRATLVEQRRYLRLDPLAQRFASVPVAVDVAISEDPEPDDTDVLAAGMATMSVALRRLPKPLLPRLALLFPQRFELELWKRLEHQAELAGIWNPSLFIFAVSHALLEPASLS
ncbi:Oxygen-regulated invasion protein OrgA [Paraburkholderia ribeironis]|uniref:Oxygen-regulated invasion protein OrgA n=1 Tax=Paraburkholderia ribeironis TaxID=1247936 RepID=A0A1N7SCE0_9BURK|nr:type III secretion apparatus protein OrgA/MxiK [Paraburkholderia ribeironis]SIT45002.1 Oxygen-regulated invasion protein OrgA [Paraburkholderia ribeironis]